MSFTIMLLLVSLFHLQATFSLNAIFVQVWAYGSYNGDR